MNNRKGYTVYVLAGVLAGLCLLTAIICFPGGKYSVQNSWVSILPPILAVVLAFLSRKILLSLFTAVLLGGLLTSVPPRPGSLFSWGKGLVTGCGFIEVSLFDAVNIQILLFVIFVMTMISILMASGGLLGIVRKLEKYARGKKSTQLIRTRSL